MSYTAIILNPDEQDRLKAATAGYVPDGWMLYCHHLTLNMDRMNGELNDLELHGAECTITLDAIGMTDKAIAVRASDFRTKTLVPLNSINKVPHITVAVNTKKGGKPKSSHEIKMWGPFGGCYTGKILTSGA